MQNPIVASNSALETPNKEPTTAGRTSMDSFAEKFKRFFSGMTSMASSS